MAQSSGGNTYGVSKFVVSADLTQGNYSTITAATAVASSGDTIFIRDLVITEDVAMKTGVNYAALMGSSGEPTVSVTGKWTYSSAGTISISNIRLITNSDFLLAVTGSAASVVNLNNCYLNCSTTTGISYTSSSASSSITLNNCNGNLGTTGIAPHSMSSIGTIIYNYCNMSNTGLSTTIANNSAGVAKYKNSLFACPVGSTGTGEITLGYCTIDTSPTNSISLTANGTGLCNVIFSSFNSGTASSITVGTGNAIGILCSSIGSSNAHAITGLGIIQYRALVFGSTSTNINVTTQVGGSIQGINSGQAPSAGFIGEQIRSNVLSGSAITNSNNTFGNITSISLTPGIWDISAVVEFSGSVTGLQFLACISTTSSTNGINGDSSVRIPTAPTGASDICLTIPSYRVTLSATTSYYLNSFATFSVGTLTSYGRISATRAG